MASNPSHTTPCLPSARSCNGVQRAPEASSPVGCWYAGPRLRQVGCVLLQSIKTMMRLHLRPPMVYRLRLEFHMRQYL